MTKHPSPPPTPDLSSLAAKWPSAFVAREQMISFTGGILTPKYIANLDSKGEGPVGSILIGKKVAYPVVSLITWLEGRSKVRQAHSINSCAKG